MGSLGKVIYYLLSWKNVLPLPLEGSLAYLCPRRSPSTCPALFVLTRRMGESNCQGGWPQARGLSRLSPVCPDLIGSWLPEPLPFLDKVYSHSVQLAVHPPREALRTVSHWPSACPSCQAWYLTLKDTHGGKHSKQMLPGGLCLPPYLVGGRNGEEQGGWVVQCSTIQISKPGG